MWKPSKNPVVEELTKTCRERSYPISNLPYIIVDGKKACYWCGDPLKTKHPAQRYCKDTNCSFSAFAWGNPQKENAIWLMMLRQDWKCGQCKFDWKKYAQENVLGRYYGTKSNDDFVTFNPYIIKRIKMNVKVRPEVDHIIPISKGGTALGLDNHWLLCYTCHKAKTKIDNSKVKV